MPHHRIIPSDVASFTPLARNRYRCNQDGKVYKRRQLAGVAMRRWNAAHPRNIPPPAKKQRTFALKVNYDQRTCRCPGCNVLNDCERGVIRMWCDGCGAELNIARMSAPFGFESLRERAYGTSYFHD